MPPDTMLSSFLTLVSVLAVFTATPCSGFVLLRRLSARPSSRAGLKMQLHSVQPLEREIQRVEEANGGGAAAGRKVKHVLTLIRHGHSVWNQDNIFTGWVS